MEEKEPGVGLSLASAETIARRGLFRFVASPDGLIAILLSTLQIALTAGLEPDCLVVILQLAFQIAFVATRRASVAEGLRVVRLEAGLPRCHPGSSSALCSVAACRAVESRFSLAAQPVARFVAMLHCGRRKQNQEKRRRSNVSEDALKIARGNSVKF